MYSALYIIVFLCALPLLGFRLGFFILGIIDLPQQKTPSDHEMSHFSSSVLGHYRQAAISSDADECASQGIKILERNGTIIDSAITTLLCNGLVNMHSMGVGGGFLMVYYRASENKTYALDAREMAPSAASPNMFVGKDPIKQTLGPLAIAVPSELKGLYEAWKKFGRVPWVQLFQEAIRMCREGTPISPVLGQMISSYGSHFPVGSNIWKLFFNKTTGRMKQEGELLYRPELADYLERVAQNPEGLINGELQRDVAADLAEMNSIIILKDLIDYKPLWRKPLSMPLRSAGEKGASKILHTVPPPSSGVLVGLALNIFSNYNYTCPEDVLGHNAILYYHRLAETFKFIFAKRFHLSNTCHMSQEDEKYLSEMMTLEAADDIFATINDSTTNNMEYYGTALLPTNDAGTSHISLIGPNGDGLSITSTINTPFGSGMVGSRTGVLFNNEMNDFSTPGTTNAFGLPASPANYISPGRRPLSSMSPIIVTHRGNTTIRVAIGGSGGSQIITSVVQAAFANLNLGLDIKAAIDFSRIHHQLHPNTLRLEKNSTTHVVKGLKDLGHEISEKNTRAAVQGVEVIGAPCPGYTYGQCLLANSDYRKGGGHDGF